MGVSVTHEPPTPPGGSPENSPPPPSGSASTSPPIPPTATPPAGPTNEAYVKLLEGSLAETNRRLQDAETRAARAAEPPPAPPPDPEAERASFYNDPKGATRTLIREELENSVGEIRDFVRSFKGQTATDQLVAKYKADQRFAPQWDAAVEQYVREQASQMPPSNVNDQTFGFLVVSAIGLKATGMLQGSTMVHAPAPTPPPPAPPATPPSPTPAATVVTPPYMHPSPPAGPPNPSNTPRTRQLNENEQRLLREYNAKTNGKKMTEAEFITWQEMPSADVANADFDKPKPPRT